MTSLSRGLNRRPAPLVESARDTIPELVKDFALPSPRAKDPVLEAHHISQPSLSVFLLLRTIFPPLGLTPSCCLLWI